jgi:hypothetical protein
MNQNLPFEQARRLFLFAAAAGAGSVALSACGGAQGQTADDAPPDPAPSPGGAPAPGPAPAPSPGPSSAPPPPSAGTAPGTFTYQLAATESSAFPPGTTTRIATGAAGMVVQVSPDLPPGRTLSLASNGDVNVVAESGAPQADLHRPWVIEVMESPIATVVNVTKGITYPYAATGNWPRHDGQAANRWNWVIGQASAGDIIEISPGAVQAVIADAVNYHSNNLDSCGLAVIKPLIIRNMPGRGRWRVWPAGVVGLEANRNAIGVFDTSSMYDTTRGNIVLQGFDLTDQFLTDAVGVRLRSPVPVVGSWAKNHASVTLRNFKIGRTSGASLSGVSGGGAELLTLEDGHIFDCGNGSGQEHNAYISARVMTLRGVRMNRTRGHSSTPPSSGNWDPSVTLEGHILKASAVTGTVEGCSFDCATLGDQSHLVQMKAGGNWTLRGNLFIDSKYPMTNRGQINMCREYKADGVTPNFEWWAGSEGNSLVVERNVFIGHFPRPIVGMFDWSTGALWAMYPPSHPTATAAQKLSTMLVRDNIAMMASPPANHVLPGFPGADNAMWINFDPTGGATWATRGNTVMTYGTNEPGFTADEKAMKRYRRSAGPVAANAGSVATRRFVYPHGHEPRNDAYGGLG